MTLKKVGYYIVKGKCVKVYTTKKRNRSGRLVNKKVNYKGRVIRKGTKVYKTKAQCVKALKRKMNKRKSTRSKGKKTVKKTVKKSPTRKSHSTRSRFGQKSSCAYALPYFGALTPSISKTWSGTQDISSSLWKWPTPPGAKAIDMQQGGWVKVKNIN